MNNIEKRPTPKVVIGMPVYNGDIHLAETLDSILNQSFTDFSLVISDNASTDDTQKICEAYAARDSRIIYHRQPKNQGMAFNFNYVFRAEGAPYFKWAAHDDLLEPDYLLECVNLLEKNPSLALAHCPSARIDDDGHDMGMYKDLGLSGKRVSERFWRVLWTINIYEIYSVMRTSYVEKVKLVGDYLGSERNLLAEVLLQGDIAYFEKSLFARRDHKKSMTAMHLDAKAGNDFEKRQKVHSSQKTMSEAQASAIRFREYFISLFRFSMPLHERILCIGSLMDWGLKRALEKFSKDDEKYRRKLYKTRVNSKA
ncbi:glycosyltransferase family 2 protein [Leptothoe spongobia]|uniref:Glycosyltransferase family 2 protein n=1 Tax=Leptothoe spongobia TAU-MAC 1115 TaxID=1967444 RepID=A0A947GLP8_9CYAN|nr:glycosyltransferase family 2 protein [Leptothoe spongobia]MBT9317473.1 glycosyltransferase family 2 protein [Leptothoe spongobia TAU-MAC 1115]